MTPDLGCQAWDCEVPADLDAPVALCPDHLRKVFGYVLGQVEARSAEAVDTVEPMPTRPAMRPTQTAGWVYFARFGDLVKIGWTSNPPHRFRALRPDAVLHLEPGTMVDEKRTHAAFAHLREKGELFRPEPDLLAFISGLRRADA